MKNNGSLFFIFILSFLFCLVIFSFFNVSEIYALEFELEAESALLMEASSGEILFEKNSSKKHAPASITKIMTLYLIFEALETGQISLEDGVVASAHAHSIGGSQIWLEIGEEMSVKDLLYAVAIGSANDASVALAEHVAGSEDRFVEKMNEKAFELGLKNTKFVNSHGLPPEENNDEDEHYMTAMDIGVLSYHTLRDFPQLLEITSIWEYFIRGENEDERVEEDREEDDRTWLINYNQLIQLYPGTDGLKTGFTDEAGHCIAATAHREGMRFIAVILGAEDRDTRNEEAVTLLNNGFRSYDSYLVVEKGETIAEAEVNWGVNDTVRLAAVEELRIVLKKDEQVDLKRIVSFDRIRAPVEENEILGSISITQKGQLVKEVGLYAEESIERTGFRGIIRQMTENYLSLILRN